MEAAIDDVAGQGNVLRTLLVEFGRLAQKLIEMEENEERRRELRKELEAQLDRIRIEIDKYQKALDRPQIMEAVAQEQRDSLATSWRWRKITGRRLANSLAWPGSFWGGALCHTVRFSLAAPLGFAGSEVSRERSALERT